MKRRAFALLALLAATACSGRDITPPPDPATIAAEAAAKAAAEAAAKAAAEAAAAVAAAVGSYKLTEFNDTTPPSTVYQDSAKRVELASGTLVLRADRTYTETLIFVIRVLLSGAVQSVIDVENGTFTVVGSQITFTVGASTVGASVGFSYAGTISNGVVTYTRDDHVTVATARYQRQ